MPKPAAMAPLHNGAPTQPMARAVAAHPKITPLCFCGVTLASQICDMASNPPAQKSMAKRAGNNIQTIVAMPCGIIDRAAPSAE